MNNTNTGGPGADQCLCKDKCLGISMYLCRGLPSALAASTAPQRPWVDLTSKQLDEIFEVAMSGEGAVNLAIAKFKENNT